MGKGKRLIWVALCLAVGLVIGGSSVWALGLTSIRSDTLVVCASDAYEATHCDYTTDGVADEVQIQQAIDTRKSVRLTEGAFSLASSLIMKSGVSLSGAGWGLGPQYNMGGTRLTQSASFDMIINEHIGTSTIDESFHLSDLYLDCDTPIGLPGASCIKFGRVAVVTIERLNINSPGVNGLEIIGYSLTQPAFAIYVDKLEMARADVAAIKLSYVIASKFTNINYTGSSPAQYGIYLDSYVKNVQWDNLYLELSDVTSAIHLKNGIYNNVFNNVDISMYNGDGIVIERDVVPPSVNTFSNVVIRSHGTIGTAGIWQKGGSTELIIDRAILSFPPSAGIRLEGMNFVVSNSTIELAGKQGILVTSGYDTDGRIVNNFISRNGNSGVSPYGIEIAGAKYTQIRGNRIYDYRAGVEKKQEYGVYESGGADYNVIVDNDLRGNKVAPVVTVGANTIARDNP